jgi:hypothetical protein
LEGVAIFHVFKPQSAMQSQFISFRMQLVHLLKSQSLDSQMFRTDMLPVFMFCIVLSRASWQDYLPQAERDSQALELSVWYLMLLF